MVALRTIPLGSPGLSRAIGDGDLVIALAPDAVLDSRGVEMLLETAATSTADAFFGDVTIAGRRIRRPAWSPTRLRSEPTAASPLAVRAGWLRAHGLDGLDTETAFRLVEHRARVAHLASVVSHHPRPLTAPGREAVDRHLATMGVAARTDESGIPRPVDGFRADVDVIIPSAGHPLEPDGPMALAGLLDSLPPEPGVHITVVTGDEFRGDAAEVGRDDVRVLRRPPGPFNFSAAINQGVLAATASAVLLLNDDMAQTAPGSIRAMAAHLTDPGVAAVGALLTYPDGTVQHDGIVIDDARPLHAFVGWHPDDTAAHGGLLAREVVAVTGACLMARRRDLLAVGGLSTDFPLSFNDIDLCVRLQRTTGRVVVEPAARFVHHETLTREPTITAAEWDRWIDRWGAIDDPWYHPGFLRPDDPHRLHRNADHLEPTGDAPADVASLREPVVRSRVHHSRAGAGAA